MKNIKYTIRSVPADLDRKLRLRAKKSGTSLNSIAIEAFLTYLRDHESKSDLDWFYGSGGIGKIELKAFSDQRTISQNSEKQ